jgi:glycosyltransferase involved in cell wall biosynthesis
MADETKHAPLVSVIIACYNYGHLVHETLESLQKQTHKNWECIVVNDGSSDNTEEVVLTYAAADTRYKYIYQENKGMSAARNKGISCASGQYIQLLDSDDLLETNKFEVHVGYLEQNPDVDLVYGDVKYFYSEAPHTYYKTVTATQHDWMPRVSGKGDAIIRSLIAGNIMAINCPLIRKAVFQKAGTFNETLRHMEDWEMFLRWAMYRVSFQYLKKENTAALVRMHSISVSRDKWSMRYQELELKEALSKQELSVVSRSFLTYEIDKLRFSLFLIAGSNLVHGRFAKAFEQYRLFKGKYKFTDLRRNGGRIVMEKVSAALNKVHSSTTGVEPPKNEQTR